MTHKKRAVLLQHREAVDDAKTAVLDDERIAGDLAELIHRQVGRDEITTALVASVSVDGIAKVIVAGDTEACEASSVMQFPSESAAVSALVGKTVLLLVNRQTQPVILGVVAQRLWSSSEPDESSAVSVRLQGTAPRSVEVDNQRVNLEASDEIRLTCGKSSLVLRRDGTVIVRGVKIVSRASQSNKIKGATVNIN